ncbi:MAG TPA: fumarylacetoacetate hydrolase family protein [Burkholderiales bacterium]|nr:fumarylacetoacetate hydrolase family protein [Burkholderiales bacterium]
MASFKLLNYRGTDGRASPGVLVGADSIYHLRQTFPNALWTSSILAVLNDWDEALPALHEHAADPQGPSTPLSDVRLLPPILYPPAIYCTGANYRAHAQEMNAEDAGVDKSTGQPYLFLKSAQHCMIGPGDAIRLPRVSQKVDWEGELAVVIGRRARNVKVEDAMQYVAGYTIMNDVSARDLARRPDWPRWNIDWFGHKNFETSAPMGPWIVPADNVPDPYACRLQLWVNEEPMQDASVSQLIFDIAEIIEYLSRRMTLLPGDVIATGTPSGVGRPRGIFLKPGDRVRIEISGIGVLENPVEEGE